MVSNNKSADRHFPVLITGGGITGLAAALFLQEQGIKYLLVEKHRSTSIHPRARTIDIRTMELFRELGLSEALREAGKALAPAWGVLQGHQLTEVLKNITPVTDGKTTFPSQMAGLEEWASQSPETGARCTQDLSEVVLHEAAVSRGGDLRFNHEMTAFEQNDDGVTATIKNRENGEEQQITADYLIAADGANSPIRNTLRAATTGHGAFGDFLNIYFEADFAEQVKGKEFSMFLINDPDLTGFLLTIDNGHRWAFQYRYYPEKGETAKDFTADKIIAILRRVFGQDDLAVKIRSVLPWQMAVNIAEQLRYGRIFLAGDSAHTMTPYAGKGANSGVQDAQNLAWKLAAVLKGYGNPSLLNTYHAERQPVDAFYATLSGQLADASGLINESKLLDNVKTLIGLPNYKYISEAIIPDGQQGDILPFKGQTGTRVPHFWLDDKESFSTLDWLKGNFVLITINNQEQWKDASQKASDELNVPIDVYEVGQERYKAWQQLTGAQQGSAMLVRPDGFVAAKLNSRGDEANFTATLKNILGVSPTVAQN